MRDDSAEILFQSLSTGSPCKQFWRGQGCPLFNVVHPAFSLSITALPTFKDALKGCFGEAVVACDIRKPCEFPSIDSCQKRLLWTHEELDFAPHPVVEVDDVLQTINQSISQQIKVSRVVICDSVFYQ